MSTEFAPMTAGGGRAAFEMRGDSMEPIYRACDLLLIDTADTEAAWGGDFLIWFEDRAGYGVRRVERLPNGKLRLGYANRKYATEDFDPAELEVAGRVCGVWRSGGL